jgi:hypothetical protein
MADHGSTEQLALPYGTEPRPPMGPADPVLRELFVVVCYGKQLRLFDELGPSDVLRSPRHPVTR